MKQRGLHEQNTRKRRNHDYRSCRQIKHAADETYVILRQMKTPQPLPKLNPRIITSNTPLY
jgi:hypothetical protein